MTAMKIQFQLQMNLFIPFKTSQREHVVILPQLAAELNEWDERSEKKKRYY